MQIILLEKVARLGEMGEVVSVKPGFARNFLLPKAKALPATEANLKKYKDMSKELSAQNETKKTQAEGLAAKLQDVTIDLARQASEIGQLYGSISSRDIAESLKAQQIEVTKNMVNIAEPIRNLGEHKVAIVLHPEVSATINVIVAR